MLPLFDPLRTFSFPVVVLRLLLAMACAGLIGYGRSLRGCAAGLRTYMLIGIGAAMSILLTQYEYQMLHGAWAETVARLGEKFDASRLASQAVTGIGFLGAGTILKVSHQQVNGLTTATGLFATVCMSIAAGLWTTGIVGFALGSGFYEGGLLGTALVMLAEAGFAGLGRSIQKRPEFSVELLYDKKDSLDQVMRFCKDQRTSIKNLQIDTDTEGAAYAATLRLSSDKDKEMLIDRMRMMPGVVSVVEL